MPHTAPEENQNHRAITESLLRSWLTTGCLFRRAMEPFFATFELTSAQWGVLHTLQRARLEGINELPLADLVGRLRVRPPSVTTVVQKLTAMGLIVGQRSAVDQRAKSIALTPAGRKLVARVLEQRGVQIERVFGCLSDEECARFTEHLDRLASHLDAMVGQES